MYILYAFKLKNLTRELKIKIYIIIYKGFEKICDNDNIEVFIVVNLYK